MSESNLNIKSKGLLKSIYYLNRVQSNLFKRDVFRQKIGLSGTLPFIFFSLISIQTTTITRDYTLSGTVQL
jgi:hypothetical protein